MAVKHKLVAGLRHLLLNTEWNAEHVIDNDTFNNEKINGLALACLTSEHFFRDINTLKFDTYTGGSGTINTNINNHELILSTGTTPESYAQIVFKENLDLNELDKTILTIKTKTNYLPPTGYMVYIMGLWGNDNNFIVLGLNFDGFGSIRTCKNGQRYDVIFSMDYKNYHVYKMIVDKQEIKLYVDNVLKATNNLNIPTGIILKPYASSYNFNTIQDYKRYIDFIYLKIITI